MNRFLQIHKNSDESVLKTAKMEYKFYYLLVYWWSENQDILKLAHNYL